MQREEKGTEKCITALRQVIYNMLSANTTGANNQAARTQPLHRTWPYSSHLWAIVNNLKLNKPNTHRSVIAPV